MTRLAIRLRAALAVFVAAALVVLSPGLEAPRLFAQVLGRTGPAQGISPIVGLPAAAPLSAPAALAPSFLTAAPSLAAASAFSAAPADAPASAAAPRAASVPAMAQAIAPHLEALAKPGAGADSSVAAGRGIEDVMTGGRSAGSGDIADVAGVDGSGAPSLSLGAAASAPVEAAKAVPAAAAEPVSGKVVHSATSYGIHRFLLKTIAALTGGVYSLPVAGPALTRSLIGSASGKSVVFSDYDDTLASYSQVLPADMVAAVEAIKAAGKTFVVISDRGDEPRKGQMTVFESLASLPVSTRAGMYVAANSGGRVYRYNDQGEPVRVFEAPAPDAAEKAKLVEAAEATKARLKEIGAEQHFPSEKNTVPSESWNVYSYALMLKVGSDDAHVRGAADILEQELSKRGFDIEVNPRYAKDPTNPPYMTFSLVTKKTAASFIASALKVEAKDVLVIGDSMYTPRVPTKNAGLAGLGEKLSGRALPRTGNRTDRNMELAVPGALMFSVGASGDPRASNLFVLSGKGPSVTLQVLKSVASQPRAGFYAGSEKFLANPNAAYGEARKKAVEIAAARGVPAEQVLFVRATASLPVGDGAHWHYEFSIPGKNGGRAIVYADTSRFLGGAFETRTSVYEDAPDLGDWAKASDSARSSIGTAIVDPEQAVDIARRAQPGMSAGVGVALDFLDAPAGGARDPWYRFFDNNGAVVAVNARTADVRVESAIKPRTGGKNTGRWKEAAEVVVPVAIIAAVAGSYIALGHILTDWLVQVEQQLHQQSPETLSNGAMFGGTLAVAAGTLGSVKKSVKGALTWIVPVAFLGAVAASYYFMGHLMIEWLGQAEQQLRQQVPEFSNGGAMFGGTLLAAAGTLRAVAKPKVGDDEIEATAKGVVSYKGGVWSESEYNGGYFNAADSLRERGATKAQMDRFRKLCEDAPVVGGRFNPWAGD